MGRKNKVVSMSDIHDLDNIRFAFTESGFFQREVERAVNDMIYKNNQENDKAFVWFMGG